MANCNIQRGKEEEEKDREASSSGVGKGLKRAGDEIWSERPVKRAKILFISMGNLSTLASEVKAEFKREELERKDSRGPKT